MTAPAGPTGSTGMIAGAALWSIASGALAQPILDPPRYQGEALRQKVERDAFSIGMSQCGSALAKAVAFLANGQDANYVIEPMGLDTRQWPVTLTMESIDPTGPSRLTVLIMQPGCGGVYTQTIAWKTNCSQVRASMFGNFKSERTLLRDVRSLKAGVGLELLLIPQGTGCVSVKKELFRGNG